MTAKQVSFDDEPLILVNEKDEVIGFLDKASCHKGNGVLHRAFSIFIFNNKGELLLQQRSDQKWLWPLFWSNSCCSHPRKGETTEEATHRRLQEELGFDTSLEYLYKFQYQASFEDKGSENELCYVYIGRYNGKIQPNPNEIARWRWISPEALEMEMDRFPHRFTPWFKMEWERIRKDFWSRVKAL